MIDGNIQRYSELIEMIGEVGSKIPNSEKTFSNLGEPKYSYSCISIQIKELIALGIAINKQEEGCSSMHVHEAAKAGCTKAEILETIGVAILMGGNETVKNGYEALVALDHLQLKE